MAPITGSIQFPALTPATGGGSTVDYALHRATGPIWVVHTVFAAPGRVTGIVRGWGERHAVGIGVFGAAVVAVQTAAILLGIA